jgi:anti-sigma regulatory factor (Ser/Thr protein kinase)/ABC-type transporter Mla MlaB component
MELLSLSGDLTRENAVVQLLTASTSQDADNELYLHASEIDRVDAVTAAALRLRIARDAREHPKGTVTLVPPSDADVAARLTALLDELPARVALTKEVTAHAPANYALVPATLVEDSQAAIALGGFALEACERARIARHRAAFITAAAMELADNAVVHADAPTDSPVVALTNVDRGRIIELAAVDTGRGIAEADDPREFLRTIPRRALDGDAGFLGDILRRAQRAGVQVQVQILAGTGRLLWTPMLHRTTEGVHLPGTSVIVRIVTERASTGGSDG